MTSSRVPVSSMSPRRPLIGLLRCARLTWKLRSAAGRRGKLAAVELADDASDIGAGLAIRRDAVVAVDGQRAGIVGGQGQRDVVAVAGQQSIEIRRAAADVLLGRKAVVDTQTGG